MADAYAARLPWPVETYDVLASLARRALPTCEIGAGDGRLTFGLAERVGRVDAIEPSRAMVDRARSGKDPSNVRWIVAAFEEAEVQGPYGLVVCAESIHWLDWSIALAKISGLLAEDASVAIVNLLEFEPGASEPGDRPWQPALMGAIEDYSTNHDFQPYDLHAELSRRGLIDVIGRRLTRRVVVQESIDTIVTRHHSMNGLARARLGARCDAFDARLRSALEPHARDGLIATEIAADIRWGRPGVGVELAGEH